MMECLRENLSGGAGGAMRVVASTGREDIAVVYILDLGGDKWAECVQALQPPLPVEQKWVLLVSTMYGCPVRCKMCDAGGFYAGKASAEEIFAQIDFLVRQRFPDRRIPSRQFKIQFAHGRARTESAVLTSSSSFPNVTTPWLHAVNIEHCPTWQRSFFERLLEIKQAHFSGRFQFQFSLHTTDLHLRDEIIPVRKWGFSRWQVQRFYAPATGSRSFCPGAGQPLASAAARFNQTSSWSRLRSIPLTARRTA
jgi:23S rRNA (adenine2503-C2)-methyltransferase